jgi:hypothetical protein
VNEQNQRPGLARTVWPLRQAVGDVDGDAAPSRRLRDRADHAITAWCERELGRARQDLAEDTGDMLQRESRPEPCGSDRNECE